MRRNGDDILTEEEDAPVFCRLLLPFAAALANLFFILVSKVCVSKVCGLLFIVTFSRRANPDKNLYLVCGEEDEKI